MGEYDYSADGFTAMSETSNLVKPDSEGLFSTPLNVALNKVKI